jgi:3-deoxy-D-manno-octulosonic-acid transferase
MLRQLYNALWYPALPVALALSGGFGDSEVLRARLGRSLNGKRVPPSAKGNGPRIWAHASSVGEIGALSGIINGILDIRSEAAVVVTAMTSSGRDAARRSMPAARGHFLAPLDCPIAVGPFLSSIRPDLVLIAETELWPNYFLQSRKVGARVAMVNARISERTVGRYRCVRRLIREALGCAELILAQSEEDCGRFVALGADPSRVHVTGNTKLDVGRLAPAALRPQLQTFAAGCPILVAGSTAPGEEQTVIEAWRELCLRFNRLHLVLAPRHLERATDLERMLHDAKISFVKASAKNAALPGARLMLLDTMGELRGMYARAAVAFVGGSLAAGRGGQSLAEPAAAGVPVLFGPYHENQRVIASALLHEGAGAIVRDSAELARAAASYLDHEPARLAAGQRARAVVERMTGGVEATLAYLRPLMGAA